MIQQIDKPLPPVGATLFATADRNNSISKRLEVYDDAGTAFVIKQMPNSKWISWHAVDRTAAEWVEINNGPRNKIPFTMES